jgi:hypothetical protein
MPRPRTPASVLDLTGRLKHDPKRYRDRIPEQPAAAAAVEPIGSAPRIRCLTFEEAWGEIVAMVPDGVLCHRDRAVVAETARLHMMVRNYLALDLMQGRVLPGLVDDKLSKLYQSYLAKLGLSPKDANNVAPPLASKKPARHEFD